MICPKCKSKNVKPITDDKKRLYCVTCNYSWKPENGDKEPEGTLSFNGIPTAKQIFDVLTRGQTFSPELRAALESQVTALLLDQWFEGMKAGQIASILYAKEYYMKQCQEGDINGKDRNDNGRADQTCPSRIRNPNRVGENRRSRRAEDTANPRSAEYNHSITERINGYCLKYSRGLKVPENLYLQIAQLADVLPSCIKKEIHWDGHKLTLEVE